MILGLITARGGSKSIPGKNVKELAGKPLIAWTIEAALNSRHLDRTVVSTDDPEIFSVSKQWGADTPFIRPAELAGDLSSHIGVVLHALEWLKVNDNFVPEYVMLLQPTVSFRTSEDIDNSIELAHRKNAASVISVTSCERHPYLSKTIDSDGHLHDFLFTIENDLPRQTLEPVYVLNGAIYLIRTASLIENKSWYTEPTHAYLMPLEHSVDIDTPWDFHVANLILQDRLRNESD